MGGNNGGMRAAAGRDPDFRGIDPDALGQLITQVRDAGAAITAWLNTHRPPPGVPTGGYRQAAQTEEWASAQVGMLARRRNYAITHPDRAGGVRSPAVPPRMRGSGARHGPAGGSVAGGPGTRRGPAPGGGPRTGGRPGEPGTPRPSRTTPAGAGKELGNYPTEQAAAKAARTDVAALSLAAKDRTPVPERVWRRLAADAGDPDYTTGFYECLGPAGTADLVAAAAREHAGGGAHLKAIEDSLGTADHHVGMSERWLRDVLARADHNGHRAAVVRLLDAADLSERTDRALDRLRSIPREP
jgi:hypothetical protein